MAQLTEREIKIKNIYDSKIEQILANCSANAIIKDDINHSLSDSLTLVKTKLRSTSEELKEVSNKSNKFQTYFIICLVIIVGLGVVIFKILTRK